MARIILLPLRNWTWELHGIRAKCVHISVETSHCKSLLLLEGLEDYSLPLLLPPPKYLIYNPVIRKVANEIWQKLPRACFSSGTCWIAASYLS
ncbi:hypothetical protein CapIbe_008726 [Capra ibex]